MPITLNGTTGISTPAIANSGTLTQTGAATLSSTLQSASTIGVGGATPAASGAGITFPSTASASSDANTLDDYEEGTWSPMLNGSVSLGTARYLKIGQLVYCEISSYNTNISSIGTGTGLNIQGAPFAMKAYQFAMPCSQQAGINYGIYDSLGTTFILGVAGTALDIQALTRNTFGGGGSLSFRFSFTYRSDN
jgi:hypothetical protein